MNSEIKELKERLEKSNEHQNSLNSELENANKSISDQTVIINQLKEESIREIQILKEEIIAKSESYDNLKIDFEINKEKFSKKLQKKSEELEDFNEKYRELLEEHQMVIKKSKFF